MDSSSARIHIGGTLNLYGPPPGKKRTWANSIRLFISLISDYGPDGDIGTPKHNVNPDRPMSLRRAAKEKGVIICEDHRRQAASSSSWRRSVGIWVCPTTAGAIALGSTLGNIPAIVLVGLSKSRSRSRQTMRLSRSLTEILSWKHTAC